MSPAPAGCGRERTIAPAGAWMTLLDSVGDGGVVAPPAQAQAATTMHQCGVGRNGS